MDKHSFNRFTYHRLPFLMVAALMICCSNLESRKGFVWQTVGQFPVADGLSGAMGGISNGALLLMGGSNFDHPILSGGKKVMYDDIYVAIDPDNIKWQHVGKLPRPLTDAAVVCVDDGLLVLGGTDGQTLSDQVFFVFWDSAKCQIAIDTNYMDLPYATAGLSAANTGDHIYIAGGRTEDRAFSLNFWRYPLSKPGIISETRWEVLEPWPGPDRAGASLVVQSIGQQTYLFLFGGKGMDYHSDAYSFDPKRNTWEVLPAMPRPAYFSSAVAVNEEYIFVFSGSDGHDAADAIALQEDYHMVKDTYAYHTTSKTWTRMNDISIGVAGASAVKWQEKILLIGGELRPGVRADIIQIGEPKMPL